MGGLENIKHQSKRSKYLGGEVSYDDWNDNIDEKILDTVKTRNASLDDETRAMAENAASTAFSGVDVWSALPPRPQ